MNLKESPLHCIMMMATQCSKIQRKVQFGGFPHSEGGKFEKKPLSQPFKNVYTCY